jgi:multiple sugar transport system ATP-binding protein
MIYVTHDQVEAMTLADRIVLLHAGDDIQRHGSVAQVGAPMDLYHRPRSRFVAEFIGSPRINLLPGRLLDAGPARALVAPDGGAAAPLAADVDARPLAAGASVMLGVRPEHLRLAAPEAAAAPGRLAARVAHVERLGECSLLYLDLEIGGQCIARVEGDARERPGQAVGLDLDPRTLHLFGADGRACNRLLTAPE